MRITHWNSVAPWETRGTALRYAPFNHSPFHFLVQPTVVDYPDLTSTEFMAYYESIQYTAKSLQEIFCRLLSRTIVVYPMHMEKLMRMLYAYSVVERNESVDLINQLAQSRSSRVRHSSLMPCNRFRRHAINKPLPLGQIPAALPTVVVKPKRLPTHPRTLLQPSTVRRSVAWFVDFKDVSKSHSVPPTEVVRPESPLPSPPSLVKSPVFDELPVALRALYQSAAVRIQPINGQSDCHHSIAPPIAITIYDEPKEESDDLSLDPVSVQQQPETAPQPVNPPVNVPDSSNSTAPYQMCAPPFSDRPERPLATAQVVLIAPTIASDNTQGKSSRYKPIAEHQASQLSLLTTVSNPVINTRRLRLVVVPNDNTNGKSSRFKSLATERDHSPSVQLSLIQRHLGHISECVTWLPSTTSALSLLSCQPGHVTARVPGILCSFNISCTSSRPPDFPAFRYLSEDPPHRRITPPSTTTKLPPLNQLLPPSIESTLPPLNVSTLPPLRMHPLHLRSSLPSSSTPPLPPPLTLPPSNACNGQQPSNVTLVRPYYNASPPLPTMLTHLSSPLPPYLVMPPLTLTLQSYTCHRTSVIVDPTTLPTFLQLTRNSSIPDAWPSGATVTCLSHPNRPLTRYARDGQLVLEFLPKTGSTGRFQKERIFSTVASKRRLVSAQAGRLSKQRISSPSQLNDLQRTADSTTFNVLTPPAQIKCAIDQTNLEILLLPKMMPYPKVPCHSQSVTRRSSLCDVTQNPLVRVQVEIFLLPKMMPYLNRQSNHLALVTAQVQSAITNSTPPPLSQEFEEKFKSAISCHQYSSSIRPIICMLRSSSSVSDHNETPTDTYRLYSSLEQENSQHQRTHQSNIDQKNVHMYHSYTLPAPSRCQTPQSPADYKPIRPQRSPQTSSSTPGHNALVCKSSPMPITPQISPRPNASQRIPSLLELNIESPIDPRRSTSSPYLSRPHRVQRLRKRRPKISKASRLYQFLQRKRPSEFEHFRENENPRHSLFDSRSSTPIEQYTVRHENQTFDSKSPPNSRTPSPSWYEPPSWNDYPPQVPHVPRLRQALLNANRTRMPATQRDFPQRLPSHRRSQSPPRHDQIFVSPRSSSIDRNPDANHN